MKKKILLIISLIVILITAWVWIYLLMMDRTSTISTTDEIDPVVDVEKQAKEEMLNDEIQIKLEYFTKSLKPNYLKISNFEKTESLWNYTDDNSDIEFYRISIDYDITENTMADYDVLINKWSETQQEFKNKKDLYKENLERKMRNNYYVAYGYDKLVKSWIVWYIEYTDDNTYYMYEMWDYIENTFWDETIDVDTLSKLEILIDYFNYKPIFFETDDTDVLNLLTEVKAELNSEKFDTLYDILRYIYFRDL